MRTNRVSNHREELQGITPAPKSARFASFVWWCWQILWISLAFIICSLLMSGCAIGHTSTAKSDNYLEHKGHTFIFWRDREIGFAVHDPDCMHPKCMLQLCTCDTVYIYPHKALTMEPE